MKSAPPWFSRTLLALGAAFAVAFVVTSLTGAAPRPSLLLAGAFSCLALTASLGSGLLRQLAFTIWIATGVVLGLAFHNSLIHFPSWFFGMQEQKLSILFVPLLQIIMFSMGTTLSIADFARVFKMPGGVLIGLACQWTTMPLVGFALAHAFGFPPEIAAGLILVGVSPSGLASNVMAFIAKANVAMSVTMTAFATLLAPLLTPILMKTLAGQLVEIEVLSMMWNMTKIVLLPVLAGLVFHHLVFYRFQWLYRVMPLISMIGILAMTILTVAPGRDNLMQLGILLIVACFLHCSAGYLLGYSVCRLLRMDRLTSRTIALEVGLQNSGMAAGLAGKMGKVATLGLAPIVFGPVMNITGSFLANWWRNHPPRDYHHE